jgi:hypothetical protein
MSTAHLYAVEFTGGLVKVGRAAKPQLRITQHRSRLAVAGIRVTGQHVAACVGNPVKAEAALIERCASASAERRAEEWFVGLMFNDVCAWVDESAALNFPLAEVHARSDVRRDGRIYWQHRALDPDAHASLICRACCCSYDYHLGGIFLCDDCTAAGYTFHPKSKDQNTYLRLNGSAVPAWSAPRHPDTREYFWRFPTAPWHKDGRPLLDVAAEPEQKPAAEAA